MGARGGGGGGGRGRGGAAATRARASRRTAAAHGRGGASAVAADAGLGVRQSATTATSAVIRRNRIVPPMGRRSFRLGAVVVDEGLSLPTGPRPVAQPERPRSRTSSRTRR